MPSVGASRSRNEEEREQRMNRKSLSNSWPDQGIGMDDGPSSSSNAGRKKMDLMLGELPGSKSYLMCGVSNLVCSHFCLRERRICEGEMSMKVLGTNFIYNEVSSCCNKNNILNFIFSSFADSLHDFHAISQYDIPSPNKSNFPAGTSPISPIPLKATLARSAGRRGQGRAPLVPLEKTTSPRDDYDDWDSYQDTHRSDWTDNDAVPNVSNIYMSLKSMSSE